ncbi:MAG: hypothetical protein KBT27_07245 [Prevotellaceae bacterium]|nr:hypothetical protein [Candidatus Faecinaster equi]
MKLSYIIDFEIYIFSFSLFSFDISSIAARILVAFEITLGIWLLSTIKILAANIIALATLVAFSIFLIWRWAMNDMSSCHCFGEPIQMSPRISLLKNGILILLLCIGWKGHSMRILKKSGYILILLLLAVFSIFIFMVKPPDFYYRIGASAETSVIPENWIGLSEGKFYGKKIICLYSTECKHCRRCSEKITGIILRHGIPEESVRNIFMHLSNNDKDAINSFYHNYGHDLAIPYIILDTEKFLSITNGGMPVILITENGTVLKEYNYLTLDEKEIAGLMSPAITE